MITVGGGADLMKNALASRPWVAPIVMSHPEDLPHALERLRERGIRRISVVGGRRLATQLIDAGVVQDIYLTTSPRIGGEPHTPMYPRPLEAKTIVRKRGLHQDSDVIFEHLLGSSGREAVL